MIEETFPQILGFNSAIIKLYIFGLVGMLLHVVKKWVRSDNDLPLVAFFTEYPKSTVSAFITFNIAFLGLIGTIDLSTLTIQSIVAALGIGYGMDSAANKHPDYRLRERDYPKYRTPPISSSKPDDWNAEEHKIPVRHSNDEQIMAEAPEGFVIPAGTDHG